MAVGGSPRRFRPGFAQQNQEPGTKNQEPWQKSCPPRRLTEYSKVFGPSRHRTVRRGGRKRRDSNIRLTSVVYTSRHRHTTHPTQPAADDTPHIEGLAAPKNRERRYASETDSPHSPVRRPFYCAESRTYRLPSTDLPKSRRPSSMEWNSLVRVSSGLKRSSRKPPTRSDQTAQALSL